jgi:hypothetical protein
VAILTMSRFRLWHQRADPEIGPTASRANVAAGKATHMTYAAARTFREMTNATPIPATLPLPEIVNRLNALQPAILTGYPSMLYALAGEGVAGRLRIAPRWSDRTANRCSSRCGGRWKKPGTARF